MFIAKNKLFMRISVFTYVVITHSCTGRKMNGQQESQNVCETDRVKQGAEKIKRKRRRESVDKWK